jgi:hypothetical protein
LGHIPLSLYDIPEFVVPISIPLTDGLANQETTEGRALGGWSDDKGKEGQDCDDYDKWNIYMHMIIYD